MMADARYNPDEFWFQVGTVVVGGRKERVYSIRCRKCGAADQYRAHGMSNETLRKHFVHKGWEIGRTRVQHVCGRCADRRRLPPGRQARAEAEQLFRQPKIDEIWHSMSREQRAAFVARHIEAMREIDMLVRRELAVAAGIIDAETPVADSVRLVPSPVEPPAIEPASPPVASTVEPATVAPGPVEPAGELPGEDDEPADWWKDLHR